MTLDDVDWLLAQWKIRLDTAAECLGNLRSMTAYDIVSGAQKLQLTGVTAQMLGGRIAALDQVWTDYAALCGTVERAGDLRKQISRFTMAPDKLREIEALLTGPGTVQAFTSPAGGDLLGAKSDQSLTLEQLLDRMNAIFVQGRDALLELDSNWTKLNARLSPVKAFVNGNRGEQAAGMPELCATLERLRPQVMADPLGANSEFERSAAPIYRRVSAALAVLVEQRKNLGADFERARSLLNLMPGLQAQSDQVFREFREKISGRKPAEPALHSERIKDLERRLAQLEGARGGSDIDPVCAELEHCLNDMKNLIAHEERVLAGNRAPLELRRELRGRLSAFKAKAVALHRAEDPKLAELARRAGDLLYRRPTPVDEVADLVAEYGRTSL